MKYFNVIVKNRSKGADKLFLYCCHNQLYEKVDVGDKVLVPFGKYNKMTEAYIAEEIYDIEKLGFEEGNDNFIEEIKEIHSVIEHEYIKKHLMKLCLWMKEEYLCRYLEIIDLYFPSGKRPIRRENAKLERTLKLYRSFDEEDIYFTDEQKKVLRKIASIMEGDENFEKKVLLEGVTSSGKTEIYIEACKNALNRGKNAVVIVPEIFLTKQLVEKFKRRTSIADEEMAIIHSSLKNRELHEEWEKVKSGSARLVIGSRMSIFTPLDEIDLIVIDEEHSDSYKSDRSPKYNTIDIGEKLAEINGATLLIGSATPSMKALKNVEDGRYSYLQLKKKYSVKEDERENLVSLVDMRDELRAGNKSIFSITLYDSIFESLESKEQVLLILTGSTSKFFSCRSCGNVVKCPKCNVAMKVVGEGRLKCNYCGFSNEKLDSCPSCNSKLIKTFGLDITSLKEEVEKLFPKASVDTVEWKDSSNIKELAKVLNNIEKKKTDILISTQLLSRGMDFENITTVGIVALDSLSNSFDFRGGEKTFQLIVHGGGRAGRGNKLGRVIIQTYKPEFYPIKYALKNDVRGFYIEEKKYRRALSYYPFGNMIQVSITGRSLKDTEKKYYDFLKDVKVNLGEKSILAKQFINNKEANNYNFNILFKLNDEELKKIKEIIKSFEGKGREGYVVHFSIDINPKKVWRN